MASEFLIVAERVLEKERRPLTPIEIVKIALDEGFFSDHLSGKTPHQTMKSKLSVHVRRLGEQSTFVRTGPGRFYLRRLMNESLVEYEATPVKPPPPQEEVLVFPSNRLDQLGRFQGIDVDGLAIADALLTEIDCNYLDRMQAEQDDDHKQVLTYVMVRRQDQLLAFRRGTYNRVESFLRGSHCIGFGGHVSKIDRNLFGQQYLGLFASAAREMAEEIRLPEIDAQRLLNLQGLRLLGVLNDDSSSVGRRHLAFVLEYSVSCNASWDEPIRGEKSITNLRWIDPSRPATKWWEFEYWSQLCMQQFAPTLAATAADYRLRRRRSLRPPHVLCLIGELGSGKSEATRVLKRDFGYSEVNSGAVVAELLGIPPVPITPRHAFQRRAWEFVRKPSGPYLLAQAIMQRVHQSSSDKVVIDGIRQLATLEALNGLANNRIRVGKLYVHTPPHIAFEFYRSREAVEPKSSFTIHDFLRLRESPVEREVREMIALADAVVYNWSGQAGYRKTIHGLMNEVGE